MDLDCKQWDIRIFPESVACEWLHSGDVCVTVMPQQTKWLVSYLETRGHWWFELYVFNS